MSKIREYKLINL